MQQNNNKQSDARKLGTYLVVIGIGIIVTSFVLKFSGMKGEDVAFVLPAIFSACLIRLLLPSFWK